MVGSSGAICTGEVVSPHVVLTAAHCVDPNVLGGAATFSVFLGNDVNAMGGDSSLWIPVSETHYDMAFDPNNLPAGHDVGVAILSSPAPVTPLRMNQSPLAPSTVGDNLRIIGYGIDSGSDTAGMSAGVKRQATTQLTNLDDVLLQFGTPSQGTCEGDSGGPALLSLGGAEEIVGITSFGPQGCMGSSYDTRVDTIAAPFANTYIAKLDSSTGGGGTGGSDGGTGGSPGGGTTGPSSGAPGALGQPCSSNADCDSAWCASINGASVCTQACDPSIGCPGNNTCANVAGQPLCVADAPYSGAIHGGCSATPGAPDPSPLTALLFLAAATLSFASLTGRRRSRRS